MIVILWLAYLRRWSLVREHARGQLAHRRARRGCVFFWVVGEDVAIFGGVGTDINSLMPLAVLVLCARPATSQCARHCRAGCPRSSAPVLARSSPPSPSAMIIFSVVSMGVASVSAAEPTLFVAQNGHGGRGQYRRLQFLP